MPSTSAIDIRGSGDGDGDAARASDTSCSSNSSTTRSVKVSPFSSDQNDSFPPPRLMKLAASPAVPVSFSCAGVARRTSIYSSRKRPNQYGANQITGSNSRRTVQG